MSKERFYELLDQVPRLGHLWDRERHEIKLDDFEKELGSLGRSEQHMARFFASVWKGDAKRFGFDVVDAMGCFDSREKRIIRDWVEDPFWP